MAARKKGKLGGGAPKQDQNLLYTAQQIWLAGLGALSRAQAGAPKAFEDLMREGSKLRGGALDAAQKVVMQAFQGAQRTVNQRFDNVQAQAGETWDNLEKIFQARVQRAIQQLGLPSADDLKSLNRRIEELAASVDRLAGKPAGKLRRPRRR